MKIQSKLLLLYVLSTIFILLFLGAFFYSSLWDKGLRSIQADILNDLQHVDFALNTFFADVESDLSALVANKSVRTRNDHDFTNFTNSYEKTFEYRISDDEQKIIDVLNNYRITHPYVNSVYMGRENGAFVRSHRRNRPTRYDPRQRPWYILGKDNPGKAVRTDAYPSITTSDINIGIVRALVDKNGLFYGVVGVDVTLLNLTQYISAYKTKPEGNIILLDNNGIVLTGLSEEMLFRKVGDFCPDLTSIFSEPRTCFTPVSIEGKKSYALCIKSSQGNWKIGILIPSKSIEKQITEKIVMTISGISIALILLSIMTMIGLKIYVVRPLKQFTDETGYIAKTSDLQRRVNIKSKDEIGVLANSYNRMMDTLKNTYQSLQDTQANLIEHRDNLEEMVAERTSLLEKTNEKLSTEIQVRIQALNELAIAKERAEESDRLKSAFLATMSHELRTPLNSIIGFTGIILQGIVGPLNEEQKKQLNMVRGSAQHLLSLINDILDISKIEAGQLQIAYEEYDLPDAIEKTLATVRPLAEKKGLCLTSSISGDINKITGDRRRTEQILLNLISNAVKFTNEGSVIVECEIGDNGIALRVADTGIGIKEKDLETIFQPFRQIDSGLTRKYEGTGLGLSICKKLVELMGGTIWVKSILGSGTTFGFYLPTDR